MQPDPAHDPGPRTRSRFGSSVRWPLALGAAAVALIGLALWTSGPDIEDHSVLVVELAGELEEAPAVDALARLQADGPALPTLLLALDMAAHDDRIDGVLLHIRALRAGYARVQELRAALQDVQAAGKKVVAWVDVGGFNATRELYLASVADEVHVEPGALAPFAGIAAQFLFLADFLDKLGVEVQSERVGEYKSAVETYTRSDMSEPARQMTEALLEGIFAQLVAGVAEGRELDEARVRTLVDAAPGTPDELVEAGLADAVSRRGEVLERAGLDPEREIPVGRYLGTRPGALDLRDGPQVALIFGDGPIDQTAGRLGRGFSGDAVREALDAAAEDEDVAAVVLRVNSPGGSPLASEQVWRAVRRVRDAKPIVVSMADAAASGGYYVASAADAIVAWPATLTGSIGVFFMRPAFAGLYEKLDIATEVLAYGRHATVTSGDAPLDAAQRERMHAYIEQAYDDFLGRVAEGRDLDVGRVDAVARGRVWLGSSAVDRGLVDEIGGLDRAVRMAADRAGIPADVDPERVVYPGPRGLEEQLREVLRGASGVPLSGSAWLDSALLDSALGRRLPASLAWGGLGAEPRLVYLPPYWLEFD